MLSRILIVDDNLANLKLLKLLLTQAGYSVQTAEKAEEALDVLSSSRPDAVLTDIQLPGITGLDLTRLIRSDPRTRETLIVGVSANAMKENIDEAYAAGCDGYITKPIDTRTFAAAVGSYLNRETAPGPHHMSKEPGARSVVPANSSKESQDILNRDSARARR